MSNNAKKAKKWGLFFSYVDHEDKKDYVNSIIQTEKGIMAANNIVKHMSKSDSNWHTQNSIYKAECDYNTIMANARRRGREEGLAEGSQQKAIEAAKNFLRMKVLSPEQIAQGTGLTLKQVMDLGKELG